MARRNSNRNIGNVVNKMVIAALLLVTLAGVIQGLPTVTLALVLLAGAVMTAAALTPWVAALRK